MIEDEIGLAKASPFSFLPEASLLLKPPLSKGGLEGLSMVSPQKVC